MTSSSQERIDSLALYFSYNSAALGAEELKKLKAFATRLTDVQVIRIEGFSQSRDSRGSNRALEMKRAQAVATALKNLGVVTRIEVFAAGRAKATGAKGRVAWVRVSSAK